MGTLKSLVLFPYFIISTCSMHRQTLRGSLQLPHFFLLFFLKKEGKRKRGNPSILSTGTQDQQWSTHNTVATSGADGLQTPAVLYTLSTQQTVLTLTKAAVCCCYAALLPPVRVRFQEPSIQYNFVFHVFSFSFCYFFPQAQRGVCRLRFRKKEKENSRLNWHVSSSHLVKHDTGHGNKRNPRTRIHTKLNFFHLMRTPRFLIGKWKILFLYFNWKKCLRYLCMHLFIYEI